MHISNQSVAHLLKLDTECYKGREFPLTFGAYIDFDMWFNYIMQ
jgi:hypothetical protein